MSPTRRALKGGSLRQNPAYISTPADGADRHVRLGLDIVRRPIQLEQKRKVVGKDDDLALGRFLRQPPGNCLSPIMIQRTDWIIEDQTRAGRRHFSEKGRQ